MLRPVAHLVVAQRHTTRWLRHITTWLALVLLLFSGASFSQAVRPQAISITTTARNAPSRSPPSRSSQRHTWPDESPRYGSWFLSGCTEGQFRDCCLVSEHFSTRRASSSFGASVGDCARPPVAGPT